MTPMFTRLIPLVAACVMVVLSSQAQDRLLTLDDLYDPKKKIDFSGSYPSGLRWSADGVHYLQAGDEDRPYRRVDAVSGRAETLYSIELLTETLVRDEGFTKTQAKKAVRQGSRKLSPLEDAVLVDLEKDLFLYLLKEDRMVRLTDTEADEKEASFSPSGQVVAFVKANDLHVINVEGGEELALTNGGGPNVLNGLLDWVYQEEVYGRGSYRGFWWSPNSTKLAFLSLDETEVPDFTVVGHESTHLKLEVSKYPKAGDPNPEVALGVVPVSGGPVKWVDLSRYES